MSKEAMKLALEQRITDYLSAGGLFNPELADHLAVRDLLIDCRKALAEPDFWEGYVPEPDNTCNNALREQGKAYPRTCKKCGLGPCVELAQQALDKKAENARELGLDYEPAQQEPVAWKNAAIRLGEELSSVGPDGYYDMTAEQWLDWAMDQRPYGKNSLPAQRTWVGLTDEELSEVYNQADWDTVNGWEYERAIEAKLRSKNEDRN